MTFLRRFAESYVAKKRSLKILGVSPSFHQHFDTRILKIIRAIDKLPTSNSTVDHPPVVALLAREALQVVDVGPGPHHHLEGRDHLVAGRAVAGRAEQPAKTQKKLNIKICGKCTTFLTCGGGGEG